MANYTIEVSESDDKALKYIAHDVQDWIENLVINRARKAKDTIYEMEVARMNEDPSITSIPADVDQVVMNADIKSYAERQAEYEDNPKP